MTDWTNYISLIDLGLSFLETFLGKMKNQLPAEVAGAVQAAIDAIAAHKDDVITKAALEAQRG